MITIKNLRNEKPRHPWQVKVDRSSPLGNPFRMDDEAGRDECIDRYDDYFNNVMLDNLEVVRVELKRLNDIHKEYGKLELFCWCAPKRCHAEVIKKYLETIDA